MIVLLVILMLPFVIFSVVFLLQAWLSPEGYEDKAGFHRIPREEKANPALAYNDIRPREPKLERKPGKQRLS